MALEEKTKIWIAIKATLPFINKCGLNSGEILVWSQDKDLGEVKKRLREIEDMVEEDEKEKKKKMKNDNNDEDNVDEPDEEILLDIGSTK